MKQTHVNILNLYILLFINYIVYYSSSETIQECQTLDIQKLCLDQETCDTCLQADVCCEWCYDQTYTNRKCNVRGQLTGCNEQRIERNSQEEIKMIKDNKFTVIKENTNLQEIIQIKPQEVHLKLRKGVPVNFTFTYKPAENYPLDLYYLGDLSLSMSQNIQIFKSLGKDLPGNLTLLTKNYRLAYGSFVDKPGMPFYFTDPESYENPCHSNMITCEKGYSFKHRLDFTKDTDTFLKKVENSKLTANVDDLDGALDAILQILSCDEKIGFTRSSRKIILLPTDSLLHSAGDGILVGATLKATDECLLDDKGEHSQPLTYDYPSLEQIEMLLRQKKVNIIFAVKTATKLYYYMNMTADTLRGFAFVAELEEESQNILELIRSGYYSFAEQVSFSINKTLYQNFDIQFFADCDRISVFNKTSTCYHVKDEPVSFQVQLTVNEIPTGKENDIIYIEEKNINENIKLSVEYLGTCKCKNYPATDDIDCINGDKRCGQCVCQNGWTGTACSEECNDYDFNKCRSYDNNGIPSRICNGNGECSCGKCECNPPFTGKYCEYECPSKRKNLELIICSGPLQGKCFEGKCICQKEYLGEDCSCAISQHDCTFDGKSICSNNGDCVCNKCKCKEGYHGTYCENKFGQNNSICQSYETLVKENLLGKGPKEKRTADHVVTVIDQSSSTNFSCDDYTTTCVINVLDGSSGCIIEFCYLKNRKTNEVSLPSKKTCTMTAGMKTFSLGIAILAAILILGIIGVIMYKLKIYKEQKEEYNQFMNANKNAVEMNPIYKSPVTNYSNPLRTKAD